MTLGDARIMTFTGEPADTAALSYDRVFVERGGVVYFGYQLRPGGTTYQIRLTNVATSALFTTLGISTPQGGLRACSPAMGQSWQAPAYGTASAGRERSTRTRSAWRLTPVFSSTRRNWVRTVESAVPVRWAICLELAPAAI